MGTSGVALASVGCTALNGAYSGGAMNTGSTTGTGFDAGDTITLTINAVGGGDDLGLYNSTGHSTLIMRGSNVGNRTYVVPAATSDTFLITGSQANVSTSFTWSCAAGGGASTSGTVQTDGTSIVSTTSGSAIGGSVGDVIDQELGGGNQPPAQPQQFLSRDEFAIVWVDTAYAGQDLSQETILAFRETGRSIYDILWNAGRGPVKTASGFEWQSLPESPSLVSSYLPQTKSDAERYVDDVFASLSPGSFKVRATLDPQWSTWADIRLSGYQQANPNTMSGLQVNALAGITYKVMPDVVIGAFAGYEAFNYEFAAITGTLKGGGATLGTYAGINVTPTLRWKGTLAWTGLGYDTQTGTTTGSFNGSRLMLATGLTGNVDLGDYIVEPSADILALWEHQSAYTDSLGTAHANRSVSNGRIALGAKVTAEQWSDVFIPYLGIYGDWRFASANAVNDGLSARVTGGITMPVSTNGIFSLGGEVGGLGAAFKTWSGNAQLKVQF